MVEIEDIVAESERVAQQDFDHVRYAFERVCNFVGVDANVTFAALELTFPGYDVAEEVAYPTRFRIGVIVNPNPGFVIDCNGTYAQEMMGPEPGDCVIPDSSNHRFVMFYVAQLLTMLRLFEESKDMVGIRNE